MSAAGQLLRIRDDDVAWREVDGGVIVLDLRTSQYLSLNASGSRMWRALVTGTTERDLVAELLGAYDVDDEVATADVARFLDGCRALDLILEEDGSANGSQP